MAKDKTARPDKPAKPFEAVIGKNPKPAKPAKPVKVPVPAVPTPTVFIAGPPFEEQAKAEVAALASSGGILDFLKARAGELGKGAGGAALQWASGALLKAIGLGINADIARIEALLNEVLANQQKILDGLDKLLLEVQFQHLITRGYPAVEKITNVYDQLTVLAGLDDDDERKREAARLQDAVLDVNGGATINLKTLGDVLLGKDDLGGSGPLIDEFARRWVPVYLKKQTDEGAPLSLYPGQLDAWLHGLFLIQYMGLAEYANARIARGDFGLLAAQLKTTISSMEAQKALLEKSIPAFARNYPFSLFDGRYYVVHQLDYVRGNPDDTQVLYGSPDGVSTRDSFAVKFRDRHRDNGDEEWLFERIGNTETFLMRKRTNESPAYVYVTINSDFIKNQVVVRAKSQAQPIRFIMARTEDKKIGNDAPIPDQYFPVFLFANRGDCLAVTYHTPHQEITTVAGPLNQAVRLRIDYAGH